MTTDKQNSSIVVNLNFDQRGKAETPFCNYWIFCDALGEWQAHRETKDQTSFFSLGSHRQRSAVKEICQKDFENEVISLLTEGVRQSIIRNK